MFTDDDVNGLIERSRNNEQSIKTLTSQYGHLSEQMETNTAITTRVFEILEMAETGFKLLNLLQKLLTWGAGVGGALSILWYTATHWGQLPLPK